MLLFTVLYCTVLYCTVLYCTVLYCTILYYTVLYCTVLYCTVYHSNIMDLTIPRVYSSWELRELQIRARNTQTTVRLTVRITRERRIIGPHHLLR